MQTSRLSIVILCALLFSFPGLQLAATEVYSCEAPDGVCSASATCEAGGYAVCAQGGPCQAGCITQGQPIGQTYFQTPGATAGHPELNGTVISLGLDMADGTEVSRALSAALGTEVEFLPKQENGLLNLSLHEVPVPQLIEILSRSGEVRVAGAPYEAADALRQAALQRPLALSMADVPVAQIEALLTSTIGVPVRLDLQTEQLTMNLKGVSGLQLLRILARYGTVEVDGHRVAPMPW